jgi:hypothetical protein
LTGNKCKRKKISNETNPGKSGNSRYLVTQEKIIERIRNASSSLDFKEKRWQNVSDSAKQLLRGLLNVDPKKRMKLKDLSRHEWIKSGGYCMVAGTQSKTTALLTPASSMCSLSDSSSQLDDRSSGIKIVDNNLLKTQINLAFNAFHTAKQKGLFSIHLKEVFEAPLAQRRHHKRSTSSNASSESSVSTISICSSLSTSATNNTAITLASLSSNTTPTKKCPTSCGKLTEQTVFNFNESYVTDYLKQQKNTHNLVFNRPITRSFTHHNNKFNSCNTLLTNFDSVPQFPNENISSIKNPLAPPTPNNHLSGASTAFSFNFDPTSNNIDLNQSGSIPFYDSSSNSSMTHFNNSNNDINSNNINNNSFHLSNGENSNENNSKQSFSCMNPPLSKRLKRISTILIDD